MNKKIKNIVRLYPKIYRYDNQKSKSSGIDWDKPVIVEEKIDGSNIALFKTKDGWEIYSRNGLIDFENNKSFNNLKDVIYTDTVIKRWFEMLRVGDTLFCEYVGIAKLAYNKTHKCLIPIEIKDGFRCKFVTKTFHRIHKYHTRDCLIKALEAEEIISKIDGITPIEGVVVKQLDSEGYIIAREKIVSSKFIDLNIINRKSKNRRERFPENEIEKFETTLIEIGVIHPDNSSQERKKIMFQNGDFLFNSYWEEEEKRELKKVKKDIKKDLNKSISKYFNIRKDKNNG